MYQNTNTQKKEIILRASNEKCQVTNTGRQNRIGPDYTMETLKGRNFGIDVLQTLREYKCQPRLIYPSMFSSL